MKDFDARKTVDRLDLYISRSHFSVHLVSPVRASKDATVLDLPGRHETPREKILPNALW
jgi:hypothetical protein